MRFASCKSNSSLCLLALFMLLGCEPDHSSQLPAELLPKVGVVTATPQLVKVTAELPGRLEPWRIAEVRARVAGIIQSRDFQEGTEISQGQQLYQIDPKPYEAAEAKAKANLAIAKASAVKAKAQSDRIDLLGKAKVVSELDQINADASMQVASAQIEAAQAELNTARINLEYARVTAPISGRIGRSKVSEGALVGENEATHLATIQQINPIYANFSQNAQDALKLRAAYASKQLLIDPLDNSIEVKLRLEDGSEYPMAGKVLFGELSVNPGTGQLEYRASFPNPDWYLLPGMYARAVIEQARYPNAFLIPQQSVTRSGQGDIVYVINQHSIVATRQVTVAGSLGNYWIVTSGLQKGERVMTDGFFKAPPGSRVEAVLLADFNADSRRPKGGK
jgi:membrane fusion protein (multidrug efflux system)